jgi:glycosyltransferase involved in cell wall biosynthesis
VNILVVNNGQSGCDFYRLQMPMAELSKRGHQVRMPEPEMTRSRVGALATAQDAGIPPDEDLEWAEVIVGRQLSYPGVVAHWQRWSAFAPTVYDTDDDVFRVDPSNPALVAYTHPGVQVAVERMLALSSLVTVTTDVLAERVSEFNANVAVLPNCVDQSVLELPPYVTAAPRGWDGARVGWTASSSHYRDLYENARGMRRFFLSHPEVEFHTLGVDYRGLLDLPTPVQHTGWLPIDRYYPAIAFDVGVCPLAVNDFNQAKSPLKALEYAARGIPAVATAGTAYDGFIKHDETGLLVHDQDDWLRHLHELVSQPELRAEMGQRAKLAASFWTIQENAALWEQAYEKLLH